MKTTAQVKEELRTTMLEADKIQQRSKKCREQLSLLTRPEEIFSEKETLEQLTMMYVLLSGRERALKWVLESSRPTKQQSKAMLL